MVLERNAFVGSLSQFTMLKNTSEMKQKNIDAIKTLIQIASENGDFLQDSWTLVLRCISQLEKMCLIGRNIDISFASKAGYVQFRLLSSPFIYECAARLGRHRGSRSVRNDVDAKPGSLPARQDSRSDVSSGVREDPKGFLLAILLDNNSTSVLSVDAN